MMARASEDALARYGLVVAQRGPIVAGASARVFPPFTARVSEFSQSNVELLLSPSVLRSHLF